MTTDWTLQRTPTERSTAIVASDLSTAQGKIPDFAKDSAVVSCRALCKTNPVERHIGHATIVAVAGYLGQEQTVLARRDGKVGKFSWIEKETTCHLTVSIERYGQQQALFQRLEGRDSSQTIPTGCTTILSPHSVLVISQLFQSP